MEKLRQIRKFMAEIAGDETTAPIAKIQMRLMDWHMSMAIAAQERKEASNA
jgi:hypothetical protein